MAKLPTHIASLLRAVTSSRLQQRLKNAAMNYWKRRAARRDLQLQLRHDLAAGPSMRFRRLEPRRVLNASFVFNGVDTLLLSNFDDVGGTTTLDMSFDGVGNDYVFTLDNGVWNAGGGNVVDADVTGVGTNILRVDRLLFEGLGDSFDLQILDDNATPNDIALDLNFTGATPIDLPNSPINGALLVDVDGNVNVSVAVNTLGSSLTITSGGTIDTTADITTTDSVDSGVTSGAVGLFAQSTITLTGNIDTSGADHLVAGATASTAGQIDIVTIDGAITLAALDASGGDATGGGGSVGGAAAAIAITSGDLGADDTHNITMNGAVATAGGNGDTNGAGATVTIAADNHLNINAAISSGGGTVDLSAGGDIIGAVGGTITTTSSIADGTSGAILMDAGTNVQLNGALSTAGVATDGAGGNVTITTTNGNLAVAAIDASGIGLGTGGNIVLDANGINADVTLTGALATNGLGFATLTADDAIVFNAAGSITAAGSGNVSVTSNSAVTNGDSGDGITMVAGSFINAGTAFAASGAILLQSTGANGGPIIARALTTRDNSIQINSGDSVSLQAAITSNGGNVDIDAVTSVGSTAAGMITTSNVVDSGLASGSLSVNAGTNVALLGAIDTSGANHTTAGSTASAAGQITIVTADGTISVSGIDASGGNATGGGASVGGAGANIFLTAADAGNDDTHDVTIAGTMSTNGGTGATAGDAGDIRVTSDNNLQINSAINAGTGNILFVTAGNVSQTAAINASGLGLIVDGTTTLNNAANNVATFAAANGGAIQFTTASNLTIDSVTVDGTTVDDVVTPADITISALSIIDGDVFPDSTDPDVSGNNVTLTATAGSIGVVGDIFQGAINPLEVVATGNLVGNALLGAIVLNPTVTGTTTLNSPNVALISAGTLNIDDLTVLGDLRIEAADVVANDASIDLTANRILFVSGQAETITVTASVFDARTAGDLIVTSTSDIELLDLDGDNVALATTTSDGSILFSATGTITVSDDVIAGLDGATNSTGVIELTAIGAAADIYINDVILSDNGDITLRADNDIRFGDPATLSPNDNLILLNNDDLFVVTTINGNVEIIADFDSVGGGELLMVNDSRVVAGRDNVADYAPNSNGLASTSVIQLSGTARVAGQSEIFVQAQDDVRLGSLQSANADTDALRVTSLAGSIIDGGDIHVDLSANFAGALTTLRAVSGVGSLNAIETTLHALDAVNSGAGAIVVNEFAAGNDLNVVNADNQGDIRILVAGGSLTVVANAFTPANGLFDVTTTSGNILMEAAEDVIIDNTLSSNSGHITVAAGDDVHINATVNTGLAGDIYMAGGNANLADVLGPQVDGINIDAAISVDIGSILLRSQFDIRTTATLTSASGDVGLVASNDILQNADILASGGNVLVDAGNDFAMNAASSITAFENIAANAGGSITLLSLTATNVGLIAGDNIIDGDASATINVSATNLSMRAGGLIGASNLVSPADTNNNAIDTDVTTVAFSAAGTYLRNVGDLSIGNVNAISVTVDVQRVNLDGVLTNETATVTAGVLAGGAGTSGPIKVVSSTGAIDVNSAVVVAGAGDVLLQALTDVTINAVVSSGTGNITIDAGDDVFVEAAVSTGAADIYIVAGDSNADAVLPNVDGININDSVTAVGRVLLDSSRDIRANASIGGSDVGLTAINNIDLLDSIVATGSILLSAGNVLAMSATSTSTATNNVVAQALTGDLLLSRITATNVALQANGSILDANGTLLNVDATALHMRAGGSIGTPDLINVASANDNAIDTRVTTVAAESATGIYIFEENGITVGQVGDIAVAMGTTERVNFNSSVVNVGTATVTLNALSDLTTTNNGSIKLVALDGSITVNDGLQNLGVGISAHGTGNVLLEARGGVADNIVTTAAILSESGHITLQAADSIQLGDDVQTGGSGTILIDALAGSLTVNDGADVDLLGIETVDGQILLRAAVDLNVNAVVQSATANIGLLAGANYSQSSLVSTTGNILVDAGNNLTMNGTSQTTAGNVVLMQAGGTITLGGVSATNVSLEAAFDILNGNGTATNVTATNLRMIADSDSNGSGSIGDSDIPSPPATNNNAIVTAVDVLAARSAEGIYILEADDIIIDNVGPVSVDVDVTRVNFNSTTSLEPTITATLAGLDDLTTTSDGPIKLVSQLGSITANDGLDADNLSVSANGSGDILLQGFTSVTINAAVESGTGNITLQAGTDLNVNATVTTAGAGEVLLRADLITVDAIVSSAAGDIGLEATSDVLQNVDIATLGGDFWVDAGQDYIMLGTALPATTTTSTAGGDMLIRAGGDVRLAFLDAATGNVAIEAGSDILDENVDDRINVTANALSMRAGGIIGGSDLVNLPDNNDNAIDTTVNTLAATSQLGIYVQETDALIIDQVNTVNVAVLQANFNSSTTANNDTLAALSDLTTTSGGAIKVITLAGTITVNDGLDGNAIGVSANGLGTVLLEARGAASDIVTTTAVSSATGNIMLLAENDVALGDDLRTGGSASILVTATNGSILVDDGVDPDLDGLVSGTGDILLQANTNITLNAGIVSNGGNIGLDAGLDILQNADMSTLAGDIFVIAGQDVVMGATLAPSITTSTDGGNVIVNAVRDIRLAHIDAGTGDVSLSAGRNILDENSDNRVNVTAANLAMVAVGTIGSSDILNAPAANDNAINTSVNVLAALSSTGIYIQEVNGVTIGHVDALSVTVTVNEVNFNSSTTTFDTTNTSIARDDLTTTNNGPIKLVTLAGNIVANDGTDGDNISVSANGSGDVLLSANGNLVINAIVNSTSGNITLAGQLIDVNANINTTGAVYLTATDVNLDGVITSGDDVLIVASNDITLNSQLQTVNGNIGIDAGRDVLQNVNITSGTGDILVLAGRDIVMAATSPGTITTSTNSGNILLEAGRDASIALVSTLTGSVSVEAVLGSIIDANGDERTNIIATSLRMEAGELIGAADAGNGTPTLNANAIIVDTATLAASGTNGIYLRDIAGNLAIGSVAGFTVTVTTTQVNFNSTTSPTVRTRTHATLEDLEAVNGAIKLVVQQGTLTLNEGGDGDNVAVSAAADILLEARGIASDILINANANVLSASGHISLIAGDDITSLANVTSSSNGTIYVLASNGTAGGGITMAAGTAITANNENIRLAADNEGNVTLALVDAGTAAVSVVAEGSIVDGNGGANNVVAGSLRLFADAVIELNGEQDTVAIGNGVGAIGSSIDSLETRVDRLAAQSATGLFVAEFDSIDVTSTGVIDVERTHFNSTRSNQSDQSLSDLVTTTNGAIQLISGDTITVLDGTDADGFGVVAAGMGTILLQAQENVHIHSIISTGGNITLTATNGEILATIGSNIIGNLLTLTAQEYAHLPNTDVNALTASITSAIDTTLTDPSWQNAFANAAGQNAINDILRGLGDPDPLADTPAFSDLRDEFSYVNQFGSSYALFLRNSGNLGVAGVTVNGLLRADAYIETFNGNLAVTNNIVLTSLIEDGAGIVLIAGDDLVVSANIETISFGVLQRVNNHDLNAQIFDGGQQAVPFSSEFVIALDAIASENDKSHVLQRVSMEFGSANEIGFLTVVHYADGTFQLFDSAEDIAVLQAGSEFLFEPPVPGATPIAANFSPKLFARETAFDQDFLRDNFELPTDALVRRTFDFFMFSNADSNNVAQIVDEAAFAKEVEGVFSVGVNGGLPFVIETPTIQIPQVFTAPVFVTVELPPQQPTPEVELPSQVQKDVDVAIYRVDYEDENLNGQVDAAELPTYEKVLDEELDKKSIEARRVIKPSEAGETPTQDDIEREKQELLNDPNQPSGAYAIIKEDTDGNRTVLDVFSIRDWPEEQAAEEVQDSDENIPRLPPLDSKLDNKPADPENEFVPAPVEPSQPRSNDSSRLIPTERQPSQLASAGLLLGSLWMMRRRSEEESSSSERTDSEGMGHSQSPDYGRRARRRRQATT